MTYEELKKLDRKDAVKMVLKDPSKYKKEYLINVPENPHVIVFGGKYNESNEMIIQFINEYIQPKSEKDVQYFFLDMTYSIIYDPILSDNEKLKLVSIEYKMLYKQYLILFSSPDKRFDWSNDRGSFIWYTELLPMRRREQFLKIVKEQNSYSLDTISNKIKKVYDFSDIEMVYLQYFCSQTKLDDLDPSNNTFLYCWSKEKRTGKTTVSSYIVSFLNGETSGDASEHKSTLSVEMLYDKFDKPNSISSRCTLIDEGGHHDMTKVYDSFKQMITSNSCKIEFKYKNGKISKRCYRNYVMTSNTPPEYFVMDEEERRILPIHFCKPEKMTWDALKKMWYEFILECNLSVKRLEEIYENIIQPNSQGGESSNIMTEFIDIFTPPRINSINGIASYFNISQVMLLPEIFANKKIPRQLVKDVIIRLYGLPDKSQRFYKANRHMQDGETKIELPF